MNRLARRAFVERALVVVGIVLFLVWTTHGDLTSGLPGGQRLALGLLAALAVLLALAWWALGREHAGAWQRLAASRGSGIVLVLLLAAAIPRTVAAMGPTAYPDLERQALIASHRMLTTGDYRPATFARPSALLYAQTAAGSALFIGGVYVDRWREIKAVQPEDLALVARLLNLAAALATAALLLRLAGDQNARAGYFAALLFAISPLGWSATSAATEDAWVALLALGVWWAITRLMQPIPEHRARVLALVRAGALLGFAAGVRPSLLLLGSPLVLALVARPGRPVWHWGALVMAIAGGVLVAVPYAVAALPTLLDAAGAALRGYKLGPEESVGAVFWQQLPVVTSNVARQDTVLALTAALGLLTWIIFRLTGNRHWRQLPYTGLLLTYLIPAGVLVLLQAYPTARLLLPLQPFLALLGGQFLANCWDAPRQPRQRRGRSQRAPVAP